MGWYWPSIEREALERQEEIIRKAETRRRLIYGELLDSPHWQDHRREEEPWLYVTDLEPGGRSPLRGAMLRQAATVAARRACRWGQATTRRLLRRHGALPSFEAAVRESGGIVSRVDVGYRAVPLEKVVGSVGGAANLRSDFFHRTGPAVTERSGQVEEAMRRGKELPALELYRMRRRREGGSRPTTEYYVLDGRRQVAVARKLGLAYVDAHVVEYKVAEDGASCSPASIPGP